MVLIVLTFFFCCSFAICPWCSLDQNKKSSPSSSKALHIALFDRGNETLATNTKTGEKTGPGKTLVFKNVKVLSKDSECSNVNEVHFALSQNKNPKSRCEKTLTRGRWNVTGVCVSNVFYVDPCADPTKIDSNVIPFNVTLAKVTQLLSNAAFCGTGVTSDFDCFWCTKAKLFMNDPNFRFVKHFGATRGIASGFVAKTKGMIYVVFAGTSSITGWLNNFDTAKGQLVHAPDGVKVHDGFRRGFREVEDIALTILRQEAMDCKTCTIMVTGHSLGAALATIFASRIATSYENPIMLYQSGSPRVGNDEFVHWFQKLDRIVASYRIVFGCDIIVEIPGHIMGSRHVKTEVWFKTSESFNLANSTVEEMSTECKIRNWNDHINYFGYDQSTGRPHKCFGNDQGNSVFEQIGEVFRRLK